MSAALQLIPMDETPTDDAEASSVLVVGDGYLASTPRAVDEGGGADRGVRVEYGDGSDTENEGRTREEGDGFDGLGQFGGI